MLWEITLGAWVTAAVIILIRLVFHRVLSARAKYLLWMLLALRLCLPVLPYSPFSLLSVVEQLPSTTNVASTEAATERTALHQAGDSPITEISTTNPTETTSNTALVTVPENAHKISWQDVVIAIWVAGVVIFLLGYLALSMRTRRRLKQAKFVDDPETIRTFLTVRKNLRITQEIRLCYGQETLIGGLRHPILLIPRELSGEQLEAALTHELLHYRSGDLWIAAFQRILCCVYWFNPVVWLCFHQARLDCERACDQRVLEQGYVSPALYAELLYTEGRMKTKLQVGTTAFGRQDLKARLTAIARFKKPALWMTILAIVLSLGVTACTLTGNEKSETSGETDYPSELSSNETSAISTEYQSVSSSEEATDSAALEIADAQEQFTYEETEKIPIGLFVGAEDGHSELWTYEMCLKYLSEENIECIDALFADLKPWSFTSDTLVYFYADNTVQCGAQMEYISGEDPNDSITISFNPDHPVSLMAYDLEIGSSNNQIGETQIWCGHSTRYWGTFDDPDVETDDCYYAAFQIGDMNYIVASEGFSEDLFSNAVTELISILS
jgi:beta-lactamase regulating signal transducer with metallopeptidase domain